MGAIAKLVSYHNKILFTFFLTILPEMLHVAILGACILCKRYHIFATRRNYAAVIKNSTSNFYYCRRKEEEEECSVCLSEYEEGDECCRLGACGHVFHRQCVERWLMGYIQTCPMCRAVVVPEAVMADFRRLEAEGEGGLIEKEFALVVLSVMDGGRCNGFF